MAVFRILSALSLQVCLQHLSERGDADFNARGAGVPLPAAGPSAHPVAIRRSAAAGKYIVCVRDGGSKDSQFSTCTF